MVEETVRRAREFRARANFARGHHQFSTTSSAAATPAAGGLATTSRESAPERELFELLATIAQRREPQTRPRESIVEVAPKTSLAHRRVEVAVVVRWVLGNCHGMAGYFWRGR